MGHFDLGARMLDPASYLFNPFCLPPLAVGCACLVLGAVVLRRGNNPASLLLMVLSGCLSVWFLSFSLVYSSARPDVALAYARVGYLGVPFIPAAALHLMAETFPAAASRRHGRFVWAAWIVSGVFSALAIGTDHLISGVTLFWWGYYVRYGWLSVPFIAFFVSSVIAAFLHGARERTRLVSPGSEQDRKAKLILTAYLVAGLGMVDFLPKFGLPLYPFGYLPFFAFLYLLFKNLYKTGLTPISLSYAADSIIATLSDGLVLFDAGGTVRFANPAFCALFGRQPGEVRDQPLASVCAPVPGFASLMSTMLSGPLKEHEISFATDHGRRALSISSSLLPRSGSLPAGTICIVRDVTERERAGEALRESEERYRGFVESFRGIVYRRTLDGGAVFVHGALAEITGYSQQELSGEGWDWRGITHPDDGELAADDPRLRLVPRFAQEREYRILRRDGQVRWVHEFLQNVVDEASQPAYVQGILLDVTDRHRLEEQLQQAQKMESIGRLAGGMAHDFNNLLTSILGYSELLLESGPAQEGWRDQVGEIRRAAKRAAALTGQLLAFSRKQIHNPLVLDANQLLLNMQRLLRPLVPEHIELAYDLCPEPLSIKADPGQVEQAVMNLVVNAVDAMPGGGLLRIGTGIAQRGEVLPGLGLEIPAGEYVLVRVEDTGHGIDPEILDKIFEPFFTTKERGKGTGLGLSSVYGVVKQSGGYVDVRSSPGRGSTFLVYLPRVREAPSSAGVEPAGAAPPRDPAGAGSLRVLLVEDEDSLRRMMGNYLAQRGYSVDTAGDGRQALQKFRERGGQFDVLITDVIMPGVGGPELASALLAGNPALRVLYISGYAGSALTHQGLLRPGVRLLQKPFSPRQLEEQMRDMLGAGPARESP